MTTTHRLPTRLAGSIAISAMVWMAAPQAHASEHGPSLKPVAKALEQMGDDFCKTFKLGCQSKGKPAAQRKPQAKPAPPPAAKTEASVTPIPRQKPPRQAPEMPAATAALAKPAEAPVPRPRPKPEDQAKPSSIVVVIPEEQPVGQKPEKPPVEKPEEARQASAVSAAVPEDPACMSQLKKAGAQFEIAAAPADGPNCRVALPVTLQSVETAAGRITLPERPLLNCAFALQFSLWLADAAAPGVAAREKSQLAKVATGPGYDCRGRNGDIGAKLSEHAAGNAVDITTLTLNDGKTIQVADAGSESAASYQMLRGLRTTACGYFSTVLGPGANAAHASHFHLDLGRHGKSASYRICE
jgi:hypothetical protein